MLSPELPRAPGCDLPEEGNLHAAIAGRRQNTECIWAILNYLRPAEERERMCEDLSIERLLREEIEVD